MKLLLATIAALCLASSAYAQSTCTSSPVEKGTIVQYLDSGGTVHAGQITAAGTGSTWNLWYFKSGVLNLATNVTQDQTQATNGTFMVLSCQTPF